LVKKINILYARYFILRDIFANISPSKVEEVTFAAWKKDADEYLKKIQDGVMKLIDGSGDVIVPSKGDLRYSVKTNTESVKRIFTMDKPENDAIDTTTYTDGSVVGEKP
jgi:hypothetical protein